MKKEVEKNQLNWYFYLAYFVLTLIFFGKFIFSPGTVGLRDDWYIPPLAEQNQERVVNTTFYLWDSNYLGWPTPAHVMGNYLDLFDWILSALHLGGSAISRYPLIFIFLAGALMMRLGRFLGLKPWPAFLAGIFYLSTPFLFNSYISGYIKVFLSYAFLPFFLEYLIRTFREPRWKNIVWTAFIFGLVSTYLNFFFLGWLLLFGFFIFELLSRKEKGMILKKIMVLILISLGPLLIHPALTSTIIDYFQNAGAITGQFIVEKNAWITYRAPTLSWAISLVGGGYNYFFDVFSKIKPLFSIWVIVRWTIPLMALVGLMIKRNKVTLFLLVLAIINLFLFKGTHPPLGGINQWLYDHFPIMSVVRNIAYVTPLIALAYAIGIGYFLQIFEYRIAQKIILGMIMAILFINAVPYFTGNFGGQIRAFQLENDSINIYNQLKKEQGDFRVWQLPMHQPMSYTQSDGQESLMGNNPMVSSPAKPSLRMVIHPTMNPQLNAFLSNTLHHQLTNQLGKITALLGIRYLTLDRHFTSHYPAYIKAEQSPWLKGLINNQAVQQFLQNQKDLRLVKEDNQVLLFQNQAQIDNHFYLGEKPILVADDFGFWRWTDFYDQNDTFLFTPEIDNGSFDNLSQAQSIWIGSDGQEGLGFAFLPKEYKIDPADFIGTNESDANTSWVATYQNQWWWYNPDWATLENSICTLTDDTFKFNYQSSFRGKGEVWAKVYFSPKGSELIFRSGEQTIGQVTTQDPNALEYRWVNLGTIDLKEKGFYPFSVESKSGENSLARIIIAPKEKVEQALTEAKKLVDQKGINLIVPLPPEPTINQTINLPSAPNYQLFVNAPKESKTKISLNQKEIRTTQKENQPFPEATFKDFKGGNLPIQITNPKEDIELLDDPSFEQSSWEGPIDCAPDKPGQTQAQVEWVTDHTQGQKAMKLTSFNHPVCMGKVLKNFNPQAIYQISFDYQNLEGSSPAMALIQAGPQNSWTAIKPIIELPKVSKWQNFNFIFTPEKLPEKIAIFLYANANLGQKTTNLYDNFQFKKIDPVKTLIFRSSAQNPSLPTLPRIESKKINPTDYEVKVNQTSDSYDLIFNETFDPNWQAVVNGKPLTNHFLINGFANGWKVDQKGEYTIKIFYGPQKTYWPLMIFSNIIFLGIILAGLYQVFKVKKKTIFKIIAFFKP